MSEPVIALNKLTKSYGKHRGIEEISFTVERGEIFGFIGPNGAGKSTTIRTLMGLLKPTGGTASVFGLDCGRQASEIAKDVGYLPPHIASFIASVAVEPTPELKSAIFSEANEKYIASLVLHERDYKKFRHPEDAELVFQMLMMLAKGMSVQLESGVDYDSMMKEFRNILDMLKHNFYKEEYLP